MKYGRDRFNERDKLKTALTKPLKVTAKKQQQELYFGRDELGETYEEELSLYQKKELMLASAVEKTPPEKLQDRIKEIEELFRKIEECKREKLIETLPDDAKIEKIVQERLKQYLEENEIVYERELTYTMRTKQDEEYWLKKNHRYISLKDFLAVKRNYPDEFIRLMSKQPLEGRLALLNCFDCMTKYEITKTAELCKFKKVKSNVTNKYALELMKECPICVQSHI